MTLRNNQDRHSPLTSSHRPPLGAQPSHGARPARGQAGHEPPPPPAAPAALAAGPARCRRPLAAARSLSGAEQTGRKPSRKASCFCVCAHGCASPECVSVCARVRVRVCALPPPSLPPTPPPLAPSRSRAPPRPRSRSPSRRRPLSSPNRAGPGFINMLIAC